MRTVQKKYRVDRRQIAYLRFLIEAYSGVANLTTLDASKGWVQFNIAPGREEELDTLIQDLGRSMPIEPCF